MTSARAVADLLPGNRGQNGRADAEPIGCRARVRCVDTLRRLAAHPAEREHARAVARQNHSSRRIGS